MALFDSLATKTLEALPRARANAEAARQRLRAHDANKPSGEDAEVSYLWNRDRTEMALRLEAANEAVKFHEEKATAAEKELADRAAATEARLIEKAAVSDEKLIRDAEALSIKLAAKLAEIDASRRRTSEYNARRGDRPHVSDAEERVRQTPAKQVPAEYRDEDVWIDGAGNQPTHYRVVKGDLVPADHGDYRKVTRKAETMCAHWLPAQMPTRLSAHMEDREAPRAEHLINVAARATHCADGDNSTFIDAEDFVELVVEILGKEAIDDPHADIHDLASEALGAFHFQIVVDEEHAESLRGAECHAARIVECARILPDVDALAASIIVAEPLLDLADASDIANRAIYRRRREIEASLRSRARREALLAELAHLRSAVAAQGALTPLGAVTTLAPAPRKQFDLATEPGLLGDLARWSLAYAFRPIAEFAQLSALAVLAPLFARRFATPTGLGLNLYLVGLGTTGAGKEALIGAPPAVLDAAGLGFLIGPGDFTSDSAIEVALRARPNFLAPIDEVGEFVGAAQHRNAAGFSRTIRKSLLELHGKSRPDGRWTGKQKADALHDKAADPLYSPSLSILGASTGAGFFESLTEANISDGFINRLIVVQGGKAGELNLDNTRMIVPTALSKALTAAYDLSSAGNLAPSTARDALSRPKMRHVPWAAGDAESAWLDIWQWQIEAEDAGRAGFTGRAAANVLVVATLRALARDPSMPAVAIGDVSWAWEFVRASIETIERGARENMSGSDFEQLVKAIEAAVIKAGVEGLPRSTLLRARGVSRHTPQMVDAAIKRLEDTEAVFKDLRGPKGGRPVNRIVATCFQAG